MIGAMWRARAGPARAAGAAPPAAALHDQLRALPRQVANTTQL